MKVECTECDWEDETDLLFEILVTREQVFIPEQTPRECPECGNKILDISEVRVNFGTQDSERLSDYSPD